MTPLSARNGAVAKKQHPAQICCRTESFCANYRPDEAFLSDEAGRGTEFVSQNNMRPILWFSMLLLVTGCAASRPAAETPAPLATEGASAALVFRPPVVMASGVRLNLARADRTPGAFIGYEDLTATYFYIRTDDRQTNDWTNRYERRAVITQVGTRYR